MPNLYERMRSSSSNQSGGKRSYSFQGPSNPEKPKSTGRFRARMTEPQETRREQHPSRFSPPRNAPAQKQGRNRRVIDNPVDDTDRPYAYGPPVIYEEQEVYHPPSVGSILADLGLRMLEVAIGAIASEVAYFFTRRRFYGRRDDR